MGVYCRCGFEFGALEVNILFFCSLNLHFTKKFDCFCCCIDVLQDSALILWVHSEQRSKENIREFFRLLKNLLIDYQILMNQSTLNSQGGN